MTHSIVLVLALLIGVVAGLRSLTAPAVVAWAALLHWINMDGTWAAWAGHPVTVAILSVAAVAELIVDLLPNVPARTAPVPFAARIILGAFAGAVIGTAWDYTWTGLGAGMIGAVLGTVAGYKVRQRLVAGNDQHDLPVALLEDAIAVLGGFGVAALTSLPL
ncbi:MAG TPA: glycine zipper 2TM domain-containing protein [Mycobacterium sp.]